MVGYVSQPAIVEEYAEEQEEEQHQDSKSINPKHPLDPLDPSFPDFSFVDSLLDFDFMEEFLEETSELEIGKKIMEMGENDSCIEPPSSVDAVSELMAIKEETLEYSVETPSSVAAVFPQLVVKEETLEVERDGNLGNLDNSIEEELGRFSLGIDSSAHSAEEIGAKSELVDDHISTTRENLVAALASAAVDNGNGSSSSSSDDDDDGSDSESGKESSSSSSSSSDSDDAEEEDEEDNNEAVEEKKEVTMQLNAEEEGCEIEEGEIRDVNGEMVGDSDEEEADDGEKMVEWSDVELEEEEEFGAVKGPIKSKNEVEVLPPVPPVEATLQPHHQMLPVGIILSTLGAQVIVEGTEKHNPLNEGSVLWITEKRSPLGIVDEIFGPVQNPYYVVRYNSETEVPAEINQGTLISFVQEFAHHVLSEKNLYKKGYDASGENDEELTDESEFSDDEKEAEHKRMQKMSKRGLNHQTGNDSRRNNKNRNRNRNGNGNRTDFMPSNHNQQNQQNAGQQSNQNQQNASAAAATSSMNNGASFFPPFPPMVPTNGNFQPPNGGWLNALPSQQPIAAFNPGGFPGNNMPWPAQNQPFQQPFNFNQGPVPNGVFPGGQMNLFANGPSPWPAMAGQNCFNPALLGMAFQMQPNLPPMNLGGQQGMMHNQPQGVQQGMMFNQPQVQQNCNLQPPQQVVTSGDVRAPQAPQQFNSGASSGRGNRPYQRGGRHGRGRGRFSGGRGR